MESIRLMLQVCKTFKEHVDLSHARKFKENSNGKASTCYHFMHNVEKWPNTYNILQCSHRKIFKVCLAFLCIMDERIKCNIALSRKSQAGFLGHGYIDVDERSCN